jgi:subtilisin family serine protease
LAQIGAERAWARTTGAGVRIGIVDTGVDLGHEDLTGKIVAATDCIGSLGNPANCQGSGQDDQGHGTHVAGIAAAYKDNGKGGAGVAPDAELVVAKVLSSTGAATTEDVIAGIRWVVDHGARVVNLSLSDPGLTIAPLRPSTQLQEGIDYAWTHGSVPVLAAGYSERRVVAGNRSTAGDRNAIVVGATGADDRVTKYSPPMGAARFAVLAPGGSGSDQSSGVLSTFWVAERPNTYRFMAGTSMAAPYVSGAIALLLAEGYNPLGAVQRLMVTANPAVDCGMGSPSCYGRIDVAEATAGPVQPSTR